MIEPGASLFVPPVTSLRSGRVWVLALMSVLAAAGCATSTAPDRGARPPTGAGDASDAKPELGVADGATSDLAPSPAGPARLCDGSGRIRFYHRLHAENASPGQKVLLELGAQALFVDGACRAWARDGEWSPLRELQLGPADALDIEQKLRLDAWSSLAGSYCIDQTDLGQLEFFFAGRLVVIGGCNVKPAPPYDLWGSVRRIVRDLYPRGAATTTDVRYALQEYKGPQDQAFAGEQPWPLGDVAAVATPLGTEDLVVHVVSGADARSLAALRSKYIDQVIGEFPLFGIPIVQPDGRRFFLYMRDLLPFEDRDGQIDPNRLATP